MADAGNAAEATTSADVRPDADDSTSGADPLNLQPYTLVDDVINAVNDYCADGFDSLDRTLAAELVLRPGEANELFQGTAELYARLQRRTEEELALFETYALQVALRIPPGLILHLGAEQVEAPDVGEAAEAVLDAALAALRSNIGAVRGAMRQRRAELTALDRDLASFGDIGELATVADAAAGKQSVADDAAAIAASALRLQPLLVKAARLSCTARGAAGCAAAQNGACRELDCLELALNRALPRELYTAET